MSAHCMLRVQMTGLARLLDIACCNMHCACSWIAGGLLCSVAQQQDKQSLCAAFGRCLGMLHFCTCSYTVLLYILGCCCWFGQLLMLLVWFAARLLVTLSPVCWRLLFRWLGCCSVLPREQQLHGRATVLCLCVAVFDSSLVSVCVMAQACVTGSVKGDTCPRSWTDFRVSRHQVAYNTGNLGNTMLSRY